MKASELRLFNYLQKQDGTIFQVSVEKFVKISLGVMSSPALYLPIPLTQQWIDKCELKQSIPLLWLDKDYSIDLEFKPTQGQDTNDRFEIWVYFNNALLKSIEYVHELQNIYFVLLGEELEFKV